MQLDIFEFAQSKNTLSGDVSLSEMPELAKTLAGEKKTADVQFVLSPRSGEKGLPAVELSIQATITTACVYCGEPCKIVIEKDIPFLLTETEEEADGLPIEEDGPFDVIVGSRKFDLTHLIEEELLLSLPAFPRHDVCKVQPQTQTEEDGADLPENNKPFSGLSELIKTKTKNGS